LTYLCCDQNRRAAVEAHPTLNGIDWLEVIDQEAPAGTPRQRTLLVRLLKPVPVVPVAMDATHVRIEGGERIRKIDVLWAAAAAPPPDPALAPLLAALDDPAQVLVVRTSSSGDHSTYSLSLVEGSDSAQPFPGFDPRLFRIDFSFKVECGRDFDCRSEATCRSEPKPPPDIHYLARDYASLRRLIVDRLSQRMPGWRDRSAADLATTLAEMIAYVGDLQHYQLDAITTEAYLHTARRRSSLRRHALLVDYPLDEGCNARTWLHLEVNSGPHELPRGARFYTRVPGLPLRILPDSLDEASAGQAGAEPFESMQAVILRPEHNRFSFHTWGDSRCCLPVGTTRATLRGHWPDLAPGDVLILQEMLGPLSGVPEDADPRRRHAVRLISVRAFGPSPPGSDPLPLTDPLPPDPDIPADRTRITEIGWHGEDALPFPLCLSSQLDEAHGGTVVEDVSLALGNNVLVDHGLSIRGEDLGTVPAPRLHVPPPIEAGCERPPPQPLPPRFRPQLAEGPVTHRGMVRVSQRIDGVLRSERVAFDPQASAAAAFRWRSAEAMPQIELTAFQEPLREPWRVCRDLLSAAATDPFFVLETEDDGSARIRFGDDSHGRRPDQGMRFEAAYRIGNGPRGNVGVDTLAHAVTAEGVIEAVTNPLPASGGRAAETSAQIRRRAPHAYRTQERAVTPADYAEVTEQLEGVQRAAAGLRWTGSWHTMFVTVDREGGESVQADGFASTVAGHLESYRMAGHDLRIDDPVLVSLEMDIDVCVEPSYFRDQVRRGLLEVLSNGELPDGSTGLFHPDRFSFGQTIYLSPIYAAVRRVAGVASSRITRFHRQGQEEARSLAEGFLKLERLEIARLDNDPNAPEHGVLRLNLRGGK
jgi:hypothetical protein